MVAFLTSRWSGQAALLEQSRLSAYEGLSETISESKLKYSAMGQRLKNIASQLDWRNNPMLWVVVRWQNAPEALRQEWEDTEKLFMRFLTQWERRSLLFAENEPLRRALYDEHMRVADEWGAFWSDFIGTVHNNPQGPRSDEAAQQLESQLNTIGDRLFDLSTYLHDFGLCLQNQAMGPWVGDVLPDRAPMPPHKTLQQLAAEPIKPEGQS